MSTENAQAETPDVQESVAPETDGQETADEGQEVVTQGTEQDAETVEDSEREAEKVTDNVQKRFDKLTYERRQAERKLAQSHEEKQELIARIEALEKSAQPKAEQPNPDNFDTHEEFIEALTDWKLEQKLGKQQEENEKKAAEQAQQAQMAKVRETFEAREAEFSADKSDYLPVVENLSSQLAQTQKNAEIINEIVNRDDGPALLYALGQNMEKAAEVFDLQSSFAIDRLNSVAESLKPQEQPESKQPLPKPPSPVKSKGTAHKDPDKMTPDEWLDWRRKQLANKG